MSVKIRFKRLGTKKRPFYRIVVADSRNARDGRLIEELGYYNPIGKEDEDNFKVNEERVKYWLTKGAKMTNAIRTLLKNQNVNVV